MQHCTLLRDKEQSPLLLRPLANQPGPKFLAQTVTARTRRVQQRVDHLQTVKIKVTKSIISETTLIANRNKLNLLAPIPISFSTDAEVPLRMNNSAPSFALMDCLFSRT